MPPFPIIPSSLLNSPSKILPRLLSTTTTTTTTASAAAAATKSSPTYCWSLLHSNSSNPNLESVLSRSIPTPTPSLVSSVLSSAAASPDHRLLSLRFFVWAGLHPLHRHSAAAFSSAVQSLLIPSQPNLLHSLLDSSSSSVSLKTFSILFRLCPHFETSLSLLRRMPEFGCRPDLPSYNSLLRLAPDADSALLIFEEISASALRPDVITYVTLVKNLSSAGRLDRARQIIAEMKSNGCRPNVVVYSALLDGACSVGDLEAAMEIMEQMEEEEAECVPNVVSYTCLMKCLCEKGMLEEALSVMDRMGRNGCRPNRVTLKTLIGGFCDKGRVREAYEFVENVVGGVSSEQCYSLLVVCLLKTGDRNGAEGILGRMMERGLRPGGLACNSLMRELVEKRCFLDGYRWIGEMEEKGLIGCVDSDVYSGLLEGLCEEGHSTEVVDLARKVAENGIRVGASCVDDVVMMLERIGGDGELASQIMRLKGGVGSSLPTYTV